MPESWLSELIDLPDTVARLDQLVSGRLVKALPDVVQAADSEHQRTRLAPPWSSTLSGSHKRTVRRYHNPADGRGPEEVQADCTQRGNWQAVLDIGAVLDPVYPQSGRWDAWKDVLAPMFTAARAVGDRAAEARALHQLGTRELCLLGVGAAAGLLSRWRCGSDR